jgi:hypothetical protein
MNVLARKRVTHSVQRVGAHLQWGNSVRSVFSGQPNEDPMNDQIRTSSNSGLGVLEKGKVID